LGSKLHPKLRADRARLVVEIISEVGEDARHDLIAGVGNVVAKQGDRIVLAGIAPGDLGIDQSEARRFIESRLFGVGIRSAIGDSASDKRYIAADRIMPDSRALITCVLRRIAAGEALLRT
jgi:hypothetical protein